MSRRVLWPWLLLAWSAWLGQAESAAAPFAIEAGDLLVANYRAGQHTVLRLNPQTGAQHRLGTFAVPTDLALSPSGEFLFVSQWNGAILRLTLRDGSLALVKLQLNPLPSLGPGLTPAGSLLATSAAGNRVVEINLASGAERLVTQGGQLSLPAGIAMLDSTHAVVGSVLNSSVVSVRLSDGVQTVLAQGNNSINQPWGVTVFGTNVYVGAHDSMLLQRISRWNGVDPRPIGRHPLSASAPLLTAIFLSPSAAGLMARSPCRASAPDGTRARRLLGWAARRNHRPRGRSHQRPRGRAAQSRAPPSMPWPIGSSTKASPSALSPPPWIPTGLSKP